MIRYGEKLFEQVFADRDAYARYKEGLQAGVESLRFEIAGSPDFHRLHWEALKDPALPKAFALDALMVRKDLRPQSVRPAGKPHSTVAVQRGCGLSAAVAAVLGLSVEEAERG